jgi:hypothetical protein
MPIEIKELHIRVNVTPPASGQEKRGPAATPGRDTALSGGARLEIIAECVEQVMKILENKKER